MSLAWQGNNCLRCEVGISPEEPVERVPGGYRCECCCGAEPEHPALVECSWIDVVLFVAVLAVSLLLTWITGND